VAQVVQPDGWEAGLVDEAVEAFGDGVGVPWAAVRLDVDQAADELPSGPSGEVAAGDRGGGLVVGDGAVAGFGFDLLGGPAGRTPRPGFVTVLLAELQVNTCWQLAEQAGHGCPDAMQRCCTGRPRPRSAS
jgi:hypothetical protein